MLAFERRQNEDIADVVQLNRKDESHKQSHKCHAPDERDLSGQDAAHWEFD